jgi:signal transduction histidine kinase
VTGYAGPQQLRRLFDAVVSIGTELSLPALLQRVLETATELADARFGALGVLDPTRTRLDQFLTVGMDGEERRRIGNLPEGHGLLGLLITHPEPVRLPDLKEHPASYGFPPNHPPMHSFLGVPIRVRDTVFGNLYLTDKQVGEVFTDVDEELVVALAVAAGVGIENARLHEQVAELALLADRDRIARDLHDLVIQRLFAIGLSLQGAGRLAQVPEVTSRVNQAVDDIDSTIREIRSVIFELEAVKVHESGLRSRLVELCNKAGLSLGFDPVLRFDGPIDSMVDTSVADQILAIVREALSNVARHAGASEVIVNANLIDGHFDVTIVDNGGGFDPHATNAGHGLANIRGRAAELGGTIEIVSVANEGTTLHARVPVAPQSTASTL